MKKKLFGMIAAAMMMAGVSAFAAGPQADEVSENRDYNAVVIPMALQSEGPAQGCAVYSENGDYRAVKANMPAMTGASYSRCFYSENGDYQAVVNR